MEELQKRVQEQHLEKLKREQARQQQQVHDLPDQQAEEQENEETVETSTTTAINEISIPPKLVASADDSMYNNVNNNSDGNNKQACFSCPHCMKPIAATYSKFE